MHSIDWLLVIVPIAALFAVAVYTRRYVKSVADFLAAGGAPGDICCRRRAGRRTRGSPTPLPGSSRSSSPGSS
jgi:hypothetical protein